MFFEIANAAKEYGCIFTLYVDDMTFSSVNSFDVNGIRRDVDILLRKYGHKPKYKKMKYYDKDKPAPVTGTIVTTENTLKVPNNLQYKIYYGFQEAKEFTGKDFTIAQERKLHSLKGQIQAAQNIEKNIFPEIDRLIKYMVN